MRLKTQTDYAIRIVLYLSDKSGFITRKERSGILGITESYLSKVIRPLKDYGWVKSDVGNTGGYMLSGDPPCITLFDVMAIMEDTVKINPCLQLDGYCSRSDAEFCQVRRIYQGYQKFLEWYFSSVTLAELQKPDAFYIKTIQGISGVARKTEKTSNLSFA